MKTLAILCCYLLGAHMTFADKTDRFLREQMAKRQIPGLQIAVIAHGKIVKTGAYGIANLEWQTPVTDETVFEIGSITKQITAAGILLLAQEGRLTLEDPLARHVPQAPASWQGVTLRHLLTHTSGIKSYTGLAGFQLTKRFTQAQFLAAIGSEPMENPPGAVFKYCNTGYSLLGYVIENVSGQPYWAFLSNRIFQPFAMVHTTDRDPLRLLPHRAAGYEHKDKQLVNRDYDLTDVFAAGAIASTVQDLARWNAALDGPNLLTEDSKRALWTAGTLNSGKPHKYGLGWFVDELNGHRNIGHGGSTSGFSATIQRFPDDHLTVIVLTNSDEDGVATTLAKTIAGFYWKKK